MAAISMDLASGHDIFDNAEKNSFVSLSKISPNNAFEPEIKSSKLCELFDRILLAVSSMKRLPFSFVQFLHLHVSVVIAKLLFSVPKLYFSSSSVRILESRFKSWIF